MSIKVKGALLCGFSDHWLFSAFRALLCSRQR